MWDGARTENRDHQNHQNNSLEILAPALQCVVKELERSDGTER